MVILGVERQVARRQVEAMIKADPIWIQLRRREKIAELGNSWRWGPEEILGPQQAMLVPFKRRLSEMLINTELGDLVELPYVLLGRHNLDAQKDDRFTWNGDEFVLKSKDIGEPEIKAVFIVDYFGGETNG